MNDQEKAKFVLAIIANEGLQISAAVAKPMAECQEWLEGLAGAGTAPRIVEDPHDAKKKV